MTIKHPNLSSGAMFSLVGWFVIFVGIVAVLSEIAESK